MTSRPRPTGRTHFSFAIQFKDGGEWSRSELGSTNLDRVLSHAFTALESYAKSGFFPAVKLIKVEDPNAPQV